MPRIRTIKPSFFFDEDLTEHPRDVRWLYVGLWTLCDEWGIFEYKPKSIKGHLYAFDEDVTRDTIVEWMECLIASEHIHLFECQGKTYGFIPTFMEHQYFDVRCNWRYPEPPIKLIELSPSYQRRLNDDSVMHPVGKGKGKGKEEGEEKKGGMGKEEARSEKEFATSPLSSQQGKQKQDNSGTDERIQETDACRESGKVGHECEGGTGDIPPSESETEESLSEGDREIIAVWRSVKGFRMPAENAATLVADLRTDFPEVDLLQESKTWAARKLSETLTTRSRPSGQLWNWMRKAQQFAQERRQNNGPSKELDPDKYVKGRFGHCVQR